MKEHRIAWGLLLVLVVIAVPLSIFFLQSGTFVPPNDPPPNLALGGVITSFPGISVAAQEWHGAEFAPSDEEEVSLAELTSNVSTMEDLIKDFYVRHPNLPEKPYGVYSKGLRKDLCEIFYGVLRGDEHEATFLKVLRGLNRDGRAVAMHALTDAEGLLLQNGYPALVNLWVSLQPADVELVVQSAVEALLWDMEQGTKSNIPLLFLTMGDRARPALPHLVWASNNHPSADMRTWCMSTAWMLAPEAPEARDVILQRLVDPDGGTRTEALQALAIRSLASVIGSGRPTEEEILERHEQLREENAQKSKAAA